ncbi:unnamed protein product [Leptosia nina]|uniref:Cell division cycle protein 26 homolog n=1 Tax=Leptosia nina TaxID=320188 RepID=A0AAV1K5C3_9NEOP
MIRRPLTEIKLKLEDLQEYENSKRDQNHLSLLQSMRNDYDKITITSPVGGPKTTEEIHERIGYAPKKNFLQAQQ